MKPSHFAVFLLLIWISSDRTMRAVACAILVLVTLYQGEALKCNYCFSKGGDLCSPTSVQTCSLTQNACGSVLFMYPLQSSFRQCMNMAVCQGYQKMPNVAANCCSTDLCN